MNKEKNKVVEIEGDQFELVPVISLGTLAVDVDSFTLKPIRKIPSILDIAIRRRGGSPCIDYNNPNEPRNNELADKLRAIRDLSMVADYLNEGWVHDWDDKTENKWVISWNQFGDKIKFTNYTYNSTNIVYFKSLETAKKAVEIVGENAIRKIYT